MTSVISDTSERRMVFVSGRAHPELADQVAEELGIEAVPTTAYTFANGELYVRFGESVRGANAFVLQSHAAPINESIMEQLIMVDALKRASAKNITVIMPCYGYARQDKKHKGREPISARLMADLFKTAGADRIMSIDLHTAQIQGFFDGPVDHLWAMATHGVLSGPAIDRLKNSRIDRIVLTNTLPLTPDKQIDKIEVLSIAPLIADALNAVFEDTSVSEIFGGENQA
jgi:phosphoribosylpyrophosphate synthetase